MKKRMAVCCLSMILFFTLTSSAWANVGGQAGGSSIKVSLQELTPGYYLGAVWDGDELLTLFDYTVGSDGKMETTVDVGKTLNSSDKLQVGISGANTGVEDVRLDVIIGSAGGNTGNNRPGGNSGSSSGGDYGSDTMYSINLPNSLTGGRVSVQPTQAAAGTTVTVTVAPEQGYLLETIKITDKNADIVRINNIRGQRYMFNMPNSAVDVNVSFRQQTIYSGNFYSLPFADVKIGDWYYEAIRYVFAQAMMTGEGQTVFNPNGNMERAMLVVALHRLVKEPQVNMPSRFSDVINNQWYTNAVIWADGSGIIKGYENGKFGPNDALTREQLAAVLYRYAQAKGMDVSAKGDLSAFTDSAKVSGWASEAMQWAVGAGIINGDNNALKPAGNATRAEVAMMIMRFSEM